LGFDAQQMANAFFTDLITTISERGRTLLRGGGADVVKHDAKSLVELCEALVSGAGEASGQPRQSAIGPPWTAAAGENGPSWAFGIALAAGVISW
jgi:hypothetical protein